MERIPAESVMVSRAFALFWVLMAGMILVAGRWWHWAHDFRETMLG